MKTTSRVLTKVEKPNRNYSLVPNDLITTDKLSAQEKIVWLYLNQTSPKFKLSQRRMAKTLNVCAKTIENAISKLKEQGYLEVKKEGKEITYILKDGRNANPQEIKTETLIQELTKRVEAENLTTDQMAELLNTLYKNHRRREEAEEQKRREESGIYEELSETLEIAKGLWGQK